MKKKLKLVLSIIMYIVALAFSGFYLFAEFKSNLMLSPTGRVMLALLICFFMYVGGLLLSKCLNSKYKEKPLKFNLVIWFVIYIILLLTLTLFDQFLGRNGFTLVKWSRELFSNYIENSFNIIPFKTIIEYIKDFNSLLGTDTIVMNLLGNIIAFMPFAFFLPLLFKKQNNLKTFTLTMVIIVLAIEILQFITLSGSCDIDDLILNVSGALLMFVILKTKSVNNLIRNIFLLEKNKIEKKSIIKIVISIIIVIVLLIGLIKVRQNLFNNNLNDLINKYNFDLKIVDETDICAEALEQFYEDDLHVYYFSCIKSNNVYAIINDNEKYLVKDLLNNNPTEYKVSISKLKDAGLDFITENKYEDINIKGKGNVSPDIKIDDSSILEIRYGDSNYDVDEMNNTTYEIQLFIVPLKSGISNIKIDLLDSNTDKKISSLKYKVSIDENLKVTYEEIK